MVYGEDADVIVFSLSLRFYAKKGKGPFHQSDGVMTTNNSLVRYSAFHNYCVIPANMHHRPPRHE